jgi:homoserine O-acetyltransferase
MPPAPGAPRSPTPTASSIWCGPTGCSSARLKAIKAPALLVYSPGDLVFPVEGIKRTAATLKANGVAVETAELAGNRGHLDGVLGIKQAEKAISAFLAR